MEKLGLKKKTLKKENSGFVHLRNKPLKCFLILFAFCAPNKHKNNLFPINMTFDNNIMICFFFLFVI